MWHFEKFAERLRSGDFCLWASKSEWARTI
jgi:hypothetical protein